MYSRVFWSNKMFAIPGARDPKVRNTTTASLCPCGHEIFGLHCCLDGKLAWPCCCNLISTAMVFLPSKAYVYSRRMKEGEAISCQRGKMSRWNRDRPAIGQLQGHSLVAKYVRCLRILSCFSGCHEMFHPFCSHRARFAFVLIKMSVFMLFSC